MSLTSFSLAVIFIISLKEFPKKRFRTTVGLSMDMKYEFEAGSFEASLAN